VSTAPGSSGRRWRYASRTSATTASEMASGASGTPSWSWRYRDHSGALMPIIAVVASGRHVPPRCSTTRRRASSHVVSESMRTPSRSKMTAVTSRP